jgi:transposase-like protein
MAEKAILSVVQEAYIHGVSTRKVDDLVRALGLDGIDKSEVSRIARELDEEVNLFLNRPLEGPYPYVWLDATYLKVRHDHRVVSKALVTALGVKMTGEREILGFAIGPCESEPFWHEFLKDLVARGLGGVKLVISDAHEGLRRAIREVLLEASWQRCTVHFMRNALAHVPRAAQQMVAAYIRTVFAQPDHETAKVQLGQVGASLEARFPRVAQLLYKCEEDILAYMAFPKEHHRQIHSTNPLERLNKEIKRRADVVGIFPNDGSALRLLGSVMIEQNDEWIVLRRYFSQGSMSKLLSPAEATTMLPPVD